MKQSKLKAFLAVHNITIHRLAKLVGIKPANLYRKMEGTHDFTYTEVYKICKYFGITDPFEIFIPKEELK